MSAVDFLTDMNVLQVPNQDGNIVTIRPKETLQSACTGGYKEEVDVTDITDAALQKEISHL